MILTWLAPLIMIVNNILKWNIYVLRRPNPNQIERCIFFDFSSFLFRNSTLSHTQTHTHMHTSLNHHSPTNNNTQRTAHTHTQVKRWARRRFLFKLTSRRQYCLCVCLSDADLTVCERALCLVMTTMTTRHKQHMYIQHIIYTTKHTSTPYTNTRTHTNTIYIHNITLYSRMER